MGLTTLEAGSVIDGRYVIRTSLAAGGFGVVYRAIDNQRGDHVALKTLLPDAIANQELIERFARETAIVANLTHPNTVRLLEHGRVRSPDGKLVLPYMVFELVRGLPLGDLLAEQGPLDLDGTVSVLVRVLDALDEAHNLGIIHRDLKPNNILLGADPGACTEPVDQGPLHARLGVPPATDPSWRDVKARDVKVVDFGLAKILEVGQRRVRELTVAGTMAGAVQYMSPEQTRAARDIDARSDLYGVAMLLYRLLTGAPPFHGKTPVEVAAMHLSAPLPPLPGALDSHPVARVWRRAGARDREARYRSAAEMAWELRAATDPGLAARSHPDFKPPPDPTTRPSGIIGRLFKKR
jgi:serine/threonine-protein kinase